MTPPKGDIAEVASGAAASSKSITESWPRFIRGSKGRPCASAQHLRLARKRIAPQNQCRLRLLTNPPETVQTERTTFFFFVLGLLSGLAFQRRCN